MVTTDLSVHRDAVESNGEEHYFARNSEVERSPFKQFSNTVTDHEIDSEKHQKIVKSFTLKRPVLKGSVSILETTNSSMVPTYFTEVHCLSFAKPDIVLRTGSDSTGTAVGAVHLRCFKPTAVGFGDVDRDPENLKWSDLKIKRLYNPFRPAKYEFEVALPVRGDSWSGFDPMIGSVGQPKKYVWDRVMTMGNRGTGVAGLWWKREYKLIDVERGQVVALFLAKNIGASQLMFYEEVPQMLEIAAVLTSVTINETYRRNHH